MEGGLVEAIFEAITVGDQQALELCMTSATIATVLEFETIYGESPLHLCVKLGGVSHLGLVHCLLATGLVDFYQRDSEGQTVLEFVHTNGDQELLKCLITIETECLDNVTACYKMMKHNSLDLFKLFLSMNKTSEEEMFKSIASALVKLNVKNFVLSEDLRHFVQWMLSDYGFRNLSGDWPGTKSPSEWKQHVDVIGECWRVISVKYDTRMYGDVDDQLLHRLHVIHNYLFFLKHKQFLSHLPLQEVVFCVAMFISVFKNSAQFNDYRLVMNKCLVFDMLRMVYRQLELIKNHLEAVEKELTEIIKEAENRDTSTKDRLIEKILEQVKSISFANKDHWIEETTKKIKAAQKMNKDALIKDMAKKIKSSDRTELKKEIQAIDEANKVCFIEEIRKRDMRVSHPQNVANRLMAGWKKGKNTEAIVAEIVSEESFDLKHLLRGRDRRMVRKVKKCNGKMKQMYSLHKILFYCDQIPEVTANDIITPIASMMRMIQVFGEAIKNTRNSPNMPGKYEPAVGKILTESFPLMNKSLREVFSHSVSLKKILVDDTKNSKLCDTLRQNMRTVRVLFQLLYVVALADARQSFYGLMRKCGSYEALRSLVLYVGDMEDMEKRQNASFKGAKMYFIDARNLFTELRESVVGKTAEFKYLQKQLGMQFDTINDLEKYFEENENLSYAEIRQACLVGDDLLGTHRMLTWKLTMRWTNKFLHRISSTWNTGHIESTSIMWMDPRLLQFSPSVLPGILKSGAITMDCAEQFEYIVHTRKLAQDLGIADALDEQTLEELNKLLKPYYDNIFLVDNKWKILASFCNKRNLKLDKPLVDELVSDDENKLQNLYDDRVKKLQFILKKHGLLTIDNLVTRLFDVPSHSLTAMEFLQLELCEILVTVGYFGDSFHYLKHRIPMIQGKNYRNYLAHDILSYNLLTDSLTEKIVINAYVFANTEVRLFANRNRKTENNISTSFPSLQATHKWAEEQIQMVSATRTKDVKRIVEAMSMGGELMSKFCCSPNANFPPKFCSLPATVDASNTNPIFVVHLNRYFPDFGDKCRDPSHQIRTALMMCNYQFAYDHTIGRGGTQLLEELFDWADLMPHLQRTELFVHLVAAPNRHRILKKMIQHGNERGVREMLPYFDEFRDRKDRGALGDALLYNVRSIAELLVHRTSEPHMAVELLAIMIHWNDIFSNIMMKVEMSSEKFQFLLTTTAQARNYTAAVYLLENELFKQFIPEAFKGSCRKAAVMGESSMLQHLLESYSFASPGMLGEVIYHAALNKQWKCVSLLLDRDAPVDVFFPGNISLDSNALLILVKFGLWRLLNRVRSVNCVIYGHVVMHPFAVAIQYGMTHDRMFRTLQRLGFDWLDNCMILHVAIRERDNVSLTKIWRQIDAYQSEHADVLDCHFSSAVTVLKRWHMISFIEESTVNDTSLQCAIKNEDKEMVKTLLDRSKTMRQLEGIGILGGIVFKMGLSKVCFGKRNENRSLSVQKSCVDMITRLRSSALMDMGWQEFNIELGVPVSFYVLSAIGEMIEPHSRSTDVDMRKSGSLSDRLNDFVTASNALFGETSVVVARFELSEGITLYFWQVEDISCVYNILPSGSTIDLSDTVNYRDLRGETALHACFPKDDLPLIQMLVEAGANPLLADETGMAAIHVSLWSSNDYSVGRYLFDVCLDRKLINDNGVSLLDLDDGNGRNKLIHIAVLTGRRDIVDRLLQQKIDVSVVNSMGLTPVQIALNCALQNALHLVKLLLDYDSSAINTADARGSTLLHTVVQLGSLDILQEILNHNPDLTLPSECTPLCTAIVLQKPDLAKCLLNHAIEKGIRGITGPDDEDLVVLSLILNDFSFAKSLLEYELEHSLEQVDFNDLPRLEGLLKKSIPAASGVPVWKFVQSRRFTDSEDFLLYLKGICNSLMDQ